MLERGRSRGGQSVATYAKRGATYAKGGGSTSWGRTSEDRLEAQEEHSQIVHTSSVSDGTRSRARRGAGRYSPAGNRRPSRRAAPGHELAEEPAGTPPRETAGRVGGRVAPAASWVRSRYEEASPVPWAGKLRAPGLAWKKGNYFSRRAPQNKKRNHARGIMIGCIGQKKNGIGQSHRPIPLNGIGQSHGGGGQ